MPEGKWFNFCLGFIFIIFLALILKGFPDSPSPWYDEGINLNLAKNLAQNGVYDFSTGPGQSTGKPYLLITTNYPLLAPMAIFFKLFGAGLHQEKIVMAVFLIAFFWLFYLAAKKYYGKKAALIGLILVTGFLPLYGNGKGALGEIPGIVYFLSGLLILDKKKWWQLILAGLLFGLAAATKSLYMLFIPALAGGEIWLAIKNKKIDWRRWCYLAAGGLLPVCLWVWTILPASLNQQSFSEFIAYYSNPYNVAPQGVMFKNFLRFFTETTPLHFLSLFAVFLISKIIKRRISQMEIIVCFFIALDWFFYLKTPGWYRYFFPAHILLFILFPFALMEIAGSLWGGKFRKQTIFIAVTVVLLSQMAPMFTNINTKLYYNPTPRIFANYINKNIPADKDILVVNNPAVAFMIDRDKVWQRLAINPYLTVGRDWFGRSEYPDYVVLNDGGNELLGENDLTPKYKKAYQADNAILWQKQ